jgi:hypothetical protein
VRCQCRGRGRSPVSQLFAQSVARAEAEGEVGETEFATSLPRGISRDERLEWWRQKARADVRHRLEARRGSVARAAAPEPEGPGEADAAARSHGDTPNLSAPSASAGSADSADSADSAEERQREIEEVRRASLFAIPDSFVRSHTDA